MRSRKGQSIVEYIVVWSALIAVILVMAYAMLQPGQTKVLERSKVVLENASLAFDITPYKGAPTTP
jgi:hypothetical protein